MKWNVEPPPPALASSYRLEDGDKKKEVGEKKALDQTLTSSNYDKRKYSF